MMYRAFTIKEWKNFQFGHLNVRVRKFLINPDQNAEDLHEAWLELERDMLRGLTGEVAYLFHNDNRYSTLELSNPDIDNIEIQFRHWQQADSSKLVEITLFNSPSVLTLVNEDPTICERQHASRIDLG